MASTNGLHEELEIQMTRFRLFLCRHFHCSWMWAGGRTKECRKCGRVEIVCLAVKP